MTNLKTCPKSYCKAPIIHWHDDGAIIACLAVVNGEPCPHEDARIPCYAPRVQPQPERPLNLPDVDTVARVIHESDGYPTTNWANRSESAKNDYRANARAVLDLIANRQPVWKRLEPGTNVEKGQRYRIEFADEYASERVSVACWTVPDNRDTYYVLRTVPAPETKESIIREFAAELDSIYTERTAGDGTWIGVLGTLVSRLDALDGESA